MTTTEKYFRALGWEQKDFECEGPISGPSTEKWWVNPETGKQCYLPHICKVYPDFKKHVLEKMEGEGYEKKGNAGKK